jgi:hypothetical protein
MTVRWRTAGRSRAGAREIQGFMARKSGKFRTCRRGLTPPLTALPPGGSQKPRMRDCWDASHAAAGTEKSQVSARKFLHVGNMRLAADGRSRPAQDGGHSRSSGAFGGSMDVTGPRWRANAAGGPSVAMAPMRLRGPRRDGANAAGVPCAALPLMRLGGCAPRW